MTAAAQHPSVRLDWLASRVEEPFDARLPIIDAHHHLFDRPGWRYLLDDYLADLRSGHDVRATVFVQARAAYRASGSEALRPVGETEFAARAADQAAAVGQPHVCAAIVGYADLTLGPAVQPVLEAHIEAAGGRFRGIRHIAAWDPDPGMVNPAYPTTEDMIDSVPFVAGLGQLVRLGLSFDAWVYFHQLPRLAALARRFPSVAIIVDHCGGILGAGRYRAAPDETLAAWRHGLHLLAECPNVWIKLGGLGMGIAGFDFHDRPRPPSSAELAAAWKPWVETCIDTFGTRRCMFESNFPVDKGAYPYAAYWNACKLLARGASAGEKADLFRGTATRFYRLA